MESKICKTLYVDRSQMRVIMYLILFLYLLNVVAMAIRLNIFYVPRTTYRLNGGGFIVFCVDPVDLVLSYVQDIL